MTPGIKIRMSADRKLLAIENDSIAVKLNGLTNSDYQKMLAFAGIELVFESLPESDGKAIAGGATQQES